MLTIKQGLKLSVILDKLDLNIDFKKISQNGEVSVEEFGGELMMQIVTKLHKAEKEIIAFVAEYKQISYKEAENINLIEFVQELLDDSSFGVFFKSAVNSKLQD